MKYRLVAGTINYWPDTDEWRNVMLDISPRGIYDHELGVMVSPDVVADLASNLPMFRADQFDEVRCHHVFEHMSLEQVREAFIGIHRVLKVGGVLDVEVPDMDQICRAWVKGTYTKDQLQQWVFGEQLPNGVHGPGDNHRYGFWEDRLRELLDQSGFEPGICDGGDLAIHFRAVKR